MIYKQSQKARKAIKEIVRELFIDSRSGEPLEIVDGQADIFGMIIDPRVNRGQIETTTQYGKSLIIALGALFAVRSKPMKVAILAPSDEQSKIIMNYAIEHIFDHPSFGEGLIDVSGIEKLKTERKKDTITWVDGSRIKVFTVSANNLKGIQGRSIMGFGADLIIVDEANLIPNGHFNKVLRMLGGNIATSKLIKVGNPFTDIDMNTGKEHHFAKSRKSKRYALIRIDWRQAVKEGRLTEEYVNEMRDDMDEVDFMVLYEVKAPDVSVENAIFNKRLLDIRNDIRFEEEEDEKGNKKEVFRKYAGLDVSGEGKDDTIFTVFDADIEKFRLGEQIKIEGGDSIEKAEEVHRLCMEMGIYALGIDVVGVGKGLADYLENKSDRTYEIQYYIAGSKAEELLYYNRKSELIYLLKKLIRDGLADISKGVGQLRKDLLSLKYKRLSDRKLKSEDPEDSPDYLDSLLAGMDAWLSYLEDVNLEVF